MFFNLALFSTVFSRTTRKAQSKVPWLDFAKLIITHWSNTILAAVISWLDFVHTVRKHRKPQVLIFGQWLDVSSKQRATERDEDGEQEKQTHFFFFYSSSIATWETGVLSF